MPLLVLTTKSLPSEYPHRTEPIPPVYPTEDLTVKDRSSIIILLLVITMIISLVTEADNMYSPRFILMSTKSKSRSLSMTPRPLVPTTSSNISLIGVTDCKPPSLLSAITEEVIF